MGLTLCWDMLGVPSCSPTEYHALGPLAPKPYTHKLIGMLGAIICAASIIFVGYMSVGVAGNPAGFTTDTASRLTPVHAVDRAIGSP